MQDYLLKSKIFMSSFLLAIIFVQYSNGKAQITDVGSTQQEQTEIHTKLHKKQPDAADQKIAKKPWTICIKMAARNDLNIFLRLNLEQMLKKGSSDKVNIVVQTDDFGTMGTRRFYIEKGNAKIMYHGPSTNSGSAESLIEFCQWALTNYEAEHYGIILSDHGTGCSIDPYMPRSISARELPDILANPLARAAQAATSDLLPIIKQEPHRGICFDDTFNSYISNHELNYAFEIIHKDILKKKWAFVGCDACFMADLPTAVILQQYADILISSENIEHGAGWRYDLVFGIFDNEQVPTAKELAHHIVHVFEQVYQPVMDEFTLSAMDLSHIHQLEQTVHEIGLLLTESLKYQKKRSVKDALQISTHHRACTSFDEPTYKDLGHLFENILQNLNLFQFIDGTNANILRTALEEKLKEGIALISRIVFANTVGKSVKQAKGISIYFPENRIHHSFGKTLFAQTNAWYTFMRHYLNA